MPDAPKHDYDALLRELREQAETTFPGWAEFCHDKERTAIAESDPDC